MTYCEWFRHGALVGPCNGAADSAGGRHGKPKPAEPEQPASQARAASHPKELVRFLFFGGGRPPFFFVDRQPVLFVLGGVVSHPLEHFFDEFFH